MEHMLGFGPPEDSNNGEDHSNLWPPLPEPIRCEQALPQSPSTPLTGISTIDLTQIFVDEIRDNPTLEKSSLDKLTIDRLRNPPHEPATLTPDERLSVKLFLGNGNGSEEIYNTHRSAILERHPEDDVLSLHLVKKKVANLSGVFPMTHDMCPGSCMAYTGPWANLETCNFCPEQRYMPGTSGQRVRKARRQFDTFPLGPQLQARFRSSQGAKDMRHRQSRVGKIMEELRQTGKLDRIGDIIDGSDFWDAYQHGQISDDDVCLIFSMDGAQLYEHKASGCWIYIWILIDVAPEKRYKKQFIIPGAIIPGPNKPKHFDSFLFPGFYHIAALQKNGLYIWDAFRNVTFLSHPWIFLAESDAIGMPDLTGFVSHHGRLGCRFRCGRIGRRKPGGSHYYAVCIKPDGYSERGCDHEDYDPSDIPDSSPAQYTIDLLYLRQATSITNYESRRLETGISRPSLFLGLSPNHVLAIPRLFPGDIMHSYGLNIPDILYKLWHGSMDCDTRNGDHKSSWRWVFLIGDTWTEHGAQVAAARQYLPLSFDRPPRNPSEKISSGYKCWEFLNWMYGLVPGLLYGKLPEAYWRHHCKLVAGVQLMFQWESTEAERNMSHRLLSDWAYEYEILYVEGMVSRMHFVPQCIHTVPHTPLETCRIGPLICSSQFTMERFIGDIGGDMNQPSNPYANLSECALRRGRVNAVKAMFPNLDSSPPPKVPIIHLGDGFTLLHPREDRPHAVGDYEDMVIFRYLEAIVGTAQARKDWVEESRSCVQRWARFRLPNGQVCRSAWKEVSNNMKRTSRNIKVCLSIIYTSDIYLLMNLPLQYSLPMPMQHPMQNEPNFLSISYAEVQYYFQLKSGTQTHTLALALKYGPPNEALLKASSGVVWACRPPSAQRHAQALTVIDVKSIRSCVAIIPCSSLPHPDHGDGPVHFVMEKLGSDTGGRPLRSIDSECSWGDDEDEDRSEDN